MSTLSNKVTLIGRAGITPVVKMLSNDKKVAKLPVATNESYKTQAGEWVNQTTWHNVVAWGPKASYLEKAVRKGQKLIIEGKLVSRTFESEGTTKTIQEVQALNISLFNSKN